MVTSVGKTAKASSSKRSMGPGKALDGDKVALYPNIFHTKGVEEIAWWSVDLEEEVVSPNVTIYFRLSAGEYFKSTVQIVSKIHQCQYHQVMMKGVGTRADSRR